MNDRPLHDDSQHDEPEPFGIFHWKGFVLPHNEGEITHLGNDQNGTEHIEPLPPVWRRFKSLAPTWQEVMEPQILDSTITAFGLSAEDQIDEPTGHAEIIQELIKRVNALESRVLLLESLNKDKFFDQLYSNNQVDVSRPIQTPTAQL